MTDLWIKNHTAYLALLVRKVGAAAAQTLQDILKQLPKSADGFAFAGFYEVKDTQGCDRLVDHSFIEVRGSQVKINWDAVDNLVDETYSHAVNKRKELELDIIQALEDKTNLEVALAKAWESGLFTKEEMEIITKDSKLYDPEVSTASTDKIDRVTHLAKKIGPTTAFVLLNLIKQYPQGDQDVEGFFKPNAKVIAKNCNINDMQVVAAYNNLIDAGLIEKSIRRFGLLVKLNWDQIQETSNISTELEMEMR